MSLITSVRPLTDVSVRRYRVMAVVVGCALLLLVLVGVPLHYLAGKDQVSAIVGQLHGIVLYPLYLLATFDVARRAGWTLLRTVLVMLAGTVPFLSFVVERRMTRQLHLRSTVV